MNQAIDGADILFNPRPVIQYIPIAEKQVCVVIDDFLLEPQKMLNYAVAQRTQFVFDPDNFYPGPELPLSREVSNLLDQFLCNMHVARWAPAETRACHAVYRWLH